MTTLASLRTRHTLAPFAALALFLAAGCTGQVEGGGTSSEGTGGTNDSGDTGGAGGTTTTTTTSTTTACTTYTGPCQPGDSFTCGSPPEVSTGTCEVGPDCTTQWGSCYTPLVLSFDGAPVEMRADDRHGFDLSGDASILTDWPTARTPWLAIDLDGDGQIGDGRELFGSMSRLSSGRRAANGFEALRELDDDGDGRLDASDPGFARLLLWRDANADRTSAPGELTAASAEIVSIELGYRREARCDARGNCEVERATFRYRDAAGVERTGAVIDVHFKAQERSAL